MFFGRQPPPTHTPPPMATNGSEPGHALLELVLLPVDEPEDVPPVEPDGIGYPGGSQPPL